jgi:hypothetical protein
MNTSDKDQSPGAKVQDAESTIDRKKTNEDQFASLQDLKAVFLAMDWEISDETTSKLIDESEKLMHSSKGDIVLVAYFKMLSSLAKYIKVHKATADKDAVGLLGSVYESMEKVIDVEGMPEEERERLVLDEIHKFLELKKKLTGSTGPGPSGSAQKAGTGKNEMEKIQKDVASLHQEMANLRKELKKVVEALSK